MQIPIENIYYLLCYAWNKLEEKDRVNVSARDYTRLIDLFAKVLLNGTKVLLKRGIDRNYVEFTGDIPGIKGKIVVGETVKSNSLLKQRTICTFDELSPDILTNQILLTTLYNLLAVKQLDKTLKDEIRTIIVMFPEVSRIPLSHSSFKKVGLNRNNRFYGFLLSVCEIIFQNSLPTEEPGQTQFIDFTRDENKMNQLFEAFLRNFYKLEQNRFPIVKGEVIQWKMTSSQPGHSDYLPEMNTDITLENSTEKIIIDAKYYRQSMAVNYEKNRIHSHHLYQLFSYLMNQEDGTQKTQLATGILIYPKTSVDYDLEFIYQKHFIKIKTVDLGLDWKLISARLKAIVDM